MKPKISVIMSVYNGEKYLKEAVNSILKQTFTDFEFIIINDGSTDNTRAILESYNDPRIFLFHQDNIGLTKSLNKGLSFAKGDYIARMDADDISDKRRFEKQFHYLNTHPEIGVTGSNINIIDEYGKIISKLNQLNSHKEIMSKLLSDNQLIHGTLFIRKELLKKVEYYDEKYTLAQDYDLLLRLSDITKFSNLHECLYSWRKNFSTGISIVKRKSQIGFRDIAKVSYLENNYSCNFSFFKLLVINWINCPTDRILTKYLERFFDDTPLILKLTLSVICRLYYRTRNLPPTKWILKRCL